MKIKHNVWLTIVLSCLYFSAFSQMRNYEYSREVKDIQGQWHRIELPDDIFGKVSSDMQDIRILGIGEKGDTLEVPYLLKVGEGIPETVHISFKLLNQSQRNGKHYLTFDLSEKTIINYIHLDVQNSNFDWKVKLEGSQNQQEWFTVLDKYRILSIKSTEMDFLHSTLRFPDAQYRYFRLEVPSLEKPILNTANINKTQAIGGTLNDYTPHKINIIEDKEGKQTLIEVDYGKPLPIRRMGFVVDKGVDYYRPFDIQYVRDSSQVEGKTNYFYGSLYSGTLNSIKNNEFDFSPVVAQKYRIRIHNYDNKPLVINAVQGYIQNYYLQARFDAPGDYQLVYGNPAATPAHYDIAHFTTHIPDSLTSLDLGAEKHIPRKDAAKTAPLFQNKAWLWAVMGLIIALLGWFTVQMMRNKAEETE